MDIMILYRSNSLSNSIASATISNLERNPIKDIKVERVNVDKRNINKYIENLDKKPLAIYVYAEDKIALNNTPEGISIMEYSRSILHKPARIPGNKLKTRVYYLRDKIEYDYEANFKKTEVYRSDVTNYNIIKKEMTTFELNHYHGKRTVAGEYFKTYEQAVDKLKSELNKITEEHKSRIEQKNQEIKDLEIKLKAHTEKMSNVH